MQSIMSLQKGLPGRHCWVEVWPSLSSLLLVMAAIPQVAGIPYLNSRRVGFLGISKLGPRIQTMEPAFLSGDARLRLCLLGQLSLIPPPPTFHGHARNVPVSGGFGGTFFLVVFCVRRRNIVRKTAVLCGYACWCRGQLFLLLPPAPHMLLSFKPQPHNQSPACPFVVCVLFFRMQNVILWFLCIVGFFCDVRHNNPHVGSMPFSHPTCLRGALVCQ